MPMNELSAKHNFKLLLVEDDPGDQVLILRSFQHLKEEQDIFVVESAEEAILFLKHALDSPDISRFGLPNVIMLDINLPGENGFSVLRLVREHPKLTTIPVLIFSTSTRPEDVNYAYLNGANCFVPKPVERLEFEQTLQAVEKFWLRRVAFASI